MQSVLQPWVSLLTLMQQSVLLTVVRGPDNIRKDHPVKSILRWYRRCILISAFDKTILKDPYIEGGGNFTGPLVNTTIDEIKVLYFKSIDEMPLHFHMHLMHCVEILGYKHPDENIRRWWNQFYNEMCKSLHVNIETEHEMDNRLGDDRDNWISFDVLKGTI